MAHLAEKTIELVHDNGSSVTVHLHGATVTSWKNQGREMLFLSRQAVFREDKGIRGGIPLVFPQFGPGPMKQHGFARISMWSAGEPACSDNGDMSCTFKLSDSPATRAMWDYKFQLELTVVLSAGALTTTLRCTNLDNKPFEFTALQHTYFRVKDISAASVVGLQGSRFVDKLDGSKVKVEDDEVKVSENVDRVYAEVLQPVAIREGGHDVVIAREGFRDLVVWNPWIEKAKGMGDFADEEYKEMLCVEPGSVAKPVQLGAGKTWEGTQHVTSRPSAKL